MFFFFFFSHHLQIPAKGYVKEFTWHSLKTCIMMLKLLLIINFTLTFRYLADAFYPENSFVDNKMYNTLIHG